MKRRTGKFKEVDDYNKIGRDFREVIRNYREFTTKTEYLLFIGLPFVCAILIFTLISIFEESNTKILSYIIEMNDNSLAVVAILAGFNTTSLSIIAASNNKVLKYLKSENKRESILKQLVSFFSFAILVQLIVLILGISLSIVSNSFDNIGAMVPFLTGLIAKIPLSLFGSLWLGLVLFAILISIRNATLLYRYVLFIADYTEEGE